MCMPPHTIRSVQVCTNHTNDFLLGALQHIAITFYITESPTCMNFICENLNVCLLKGYLLLTYYYFVFIHLTSYLKNNLFSVKKTFVLTHLT